MEIPGHFFNSYEDILKLKVKQSPDKLSGLISTIRVIVVLKTI